MKEKKNDICSSIVFIIFAVFLFVGSWWIPPTTSDILGSRFFPRLIAGIIAFLSVFQLIGAMSAIKNSKGENAEKKEEKNGFSISLLLTVAALFVYYILVLQIGFTITSILYLLFQSAVLMSKEDFKNRKKVILLILVSIIVPIFINTIFWEVFLIALPAGNLF